MNKIFVAGLFLSAALLPAQTAVNGRGTVLVAKNEVSEPAAVTPSDIPTSSARRISTGVVAPKLIAAPEVHVAISDFPANTLANQKVVVAFRVDEKGVPQNVHLLKSVNQTVDARVLAAVSAARFEPATLDDQSVAMDMDLNIKFEAR
ncbi:MAG: TonB family protein [Acidobacteriaceae bacterium]|nr:TonB family protein [Acidobacteriaceae bacterium]